VEAVIAIQPDRRLRDRKAPWVRIATAVLRIVIIYLMLAAIVAMGSGNAHPFVYAGF
jgi:hypothetical protein